LTLPILSAAQRNFLEKLYTSIPHVTDLGVEVAEIGTASATLRLPYRDQLLGDTVHRLLHTGVITSVIDSVCGLAVLAALPAPVTIATLDLRVDYLRPARAGEALFARADCFRLTRHIAFVSASAYQDPARPVASAAATFMLQSRRTGMSTP
jgi:uncharacterized protein (TIGR00369 family)